MKPEASLALATLAFVGTHLLMSHPLRPGLVARLGERGFLVAYTWVSLATFVWMVLAYGPSDPEPSLWRGYFYYGWYVASGLMLVASILLAGSLMGNPAFPKPGAEAKEIGPPKGVFAITRHPMNMSFMLWALVHIWLWGSPRNLIVAGGIFILALAGSIGQDRKKERLLGDAWRKWEAQTSFVPFAALIAGRAPWRALLASGWAVLGGLIFWALVTRFHAPLVSPLGGIPPGINLS